MYAKLDPDEAQVVLDNLRDAPVSGTDVGTLINARAALGTAIESDAGAWMRHLIAQGKHPNEARAHVRHRFGADV